MTNLTQAVAQAQALCRDRGVRLTDQRRRVLEILSVAPRPIGAYEILSIMGDGPKSVAPPTVYRALDFLLEQGFAHKLESLHAYVGCAHPGLPHLAQFLICDRCGGVIEMDDAGIVDNLNRVAQGTGFRPARGVVELLGTCARCTNE